MKTRIYGPALLTTSTAALYTVPSNKVATIRRIRVSNPTGSGGPFTFTCTIGADAAGTRFYEVVSVSEGSSHDIWGPYTLAEGETFHAYASTTNKLVIVVSGDLDDEA